MTAWQKTTAYRSPGLYRGLTLAVLLVLFALTSITAFAQAPADARTSAPAGSQITNTATATFTVSGTQLTSSSAQVVVNVGQVDGFVLNPNDAVNSAISGTGTSGAQWLTYYTLTNYSNGPENITITLAAGTAPVTGLKLVPAPGGVATTSASTISGTTITIAQGATYQFAAVGTWNASGTGSYTVTVLDVPTAGSNYSQPSAYAPSDKATRLVSTANLTVTVGAVVAVTKTFTTAAGGTTSVTSGTGTSLWVRLHYTNTGDKASGRVVVTDNLSGTGLTYVAGTAHYGSAIALADTGTAALYATASASTTLNSTASTTNVTASAGGAETVNFWYDTTNKIVYANINTDAVGDAGDIYFQVAVTNTPGSYTNTEATTFMDAQTSGTQQTPANTSATYVLAATYTNTLKTSYLSATLGSTATDASATAAAPVLFSLQLVNTGNGSDTYTLGGLTSGNFPSGTQFNYYLNGGTPLAPSISGSALGSTVSLAAGATYNYILQVILPNGTSGGPYTITPSVTSAEATVTTVTDTLTAEVLAVDVTSALTAGTSPAGAGYGVGAPAVTGPSITPTGSATYTFAVYVKNGESASDSYTLAAAGTQAGGSLPTGLTVAFYNVGSAAPACTTLGTAISAAVTIAANTTSEYCAVVTFANGTLPNTDSIYFSATSTGSYPVSDYLYDNVVVAPFVSFAVTVDSQSVVAGTTAVYTEKITNTGNVAGVPTLSSFTSAITAGTFTTQFASAVNSGVYTIVTPSSSTALAAVPVGGFDTFYVLTTPAASDAVGNSDVVTLTVTGAGSAPYATYTSTTTGTYTTTVLSTASNVTIVKKQVLDANCSATTATLPGLSYTTSAVTATPGQCVAYSITATNNTGVAVTALSLTDVLNTAYVTLQSTPTPAFLAGTQVSDYSGAGAATPTMNGSAETITSGTIATLPIGDYVTFFFEIKLN